MERTGNTIARYWKAAVVVGTVAALYASVLSKLGGDLWADENYSHGLLIPFVVAYIVWTERVNLSSQRGEPRPFFGAAIVSAAFVMLLGGTLGAELFTQRTSLVLMAAGIIVFFFGSKILRALLVPIVLVLLAIPIPQIIFNSIALPLQVLASKLAVIGIRLAGVPSLRNGNVIDILPSGSTQRVALEVVEACSGIRSLMTLVTLAVVLVYFTRSGPMLTAAPLKNIVRNRDFHRMALLMAAAVPVAVLANAARVATTGYLTYLTGTRATEGTLHEALGISAYAISFLMLLGINVLLKKVLKQSPAGSEAAVAERGPALSTFGFASSSMRFGSLLVLLVFAAATVNWLSLRGEVSVARQPLSSLPTTLGKWNQKGEERRFDAQTESVLRATDYTMRDYRSGDRTANVYVGYYESQRGGATYHSPKNCLPGSGWVMKDPETVEIRTPSGEVFEANRFIIETGNYRAVMIYWYQGRGRIEASEYVDKFNTVLDSVLKRRTDGSMVRVMTSIGRDESAAMAAAIDISAHLADSLNPLIPN